MIILDAYAVLAFLKEEQAADEVRDILDGPDKARVTSLGLAEILDHLIRIVGAAPEQAALDLAQLDLGEAVPIDAAIGTRAGLLRARHYHRRTRSVSLADCVAADVARTSQALLATADPPLLELCHEETIGIIPLPDSSGSRWTTS